MYDEPEAANVVPSGKPVLAMITDGRCITSTLDALENGAANGKPMPRAALDQARDQAAALLEQVLDAYAQEVAVGEVGAYGNARASNGEPIASRCPTGLLYGRIQSGKTLAMITFAALAIDNGFRVVVVLTSDNVKLVEQTASRFSALDSIVKSSTRVADWAADAQHVKKNLPYVGVVLVCAKNQSHLASLIDFLESIGAADYPALIMDDEADQATLDTTTNARSAGRPNAPGYGSTIGRRAVCNDKPDEMGRSVGELMRHYVLLQNTDSPLRPKFTKLLEPGHGYTGGDAFFSGEHYDDELPPLVFVREEESDELERGIRIAPPGLIAAISAFLVGAGAQALGDPTVRARAQNFLCHTSQKRMEHDKVSGLIRAYLDTVGDELRKPDLRGEVAVHFSKAHGELARTVSSLPDLNEILVDLRQRLPRRQVIVVNSDGANAEFSRGMNFIVGGNILGRGLTIDNLLVTYYLRRAKVSQMDTMLQHARMFGYRRAIMPYTRVFLPERLALRFHRIHTAEEHLRGLLGDPDRRARIPVEVSEGLRATRPGVLDMGSIVAYTPGQHLYPAAPLVTKDAHKDHDRAMKDVARLGGRFTDEREAHDPIDVSLDDMADLVGRLPYDATDEDTWDPRAIQGVLKSGAQRFRGRGLLYCRTMKRTKFRQGALSGEELKTLRGRGLPVLCVFLDIGKRYKTTRGYEYEHEFTYPSLVLPDNVDMPAHVFNVSE
jgi:hypothetical protein